MSFIQWCCERGAKSYVAKEISGRGRRRSRDEKGNQGVGDLRFINISQLFSTYFFFNYFILYHFFYSFFTHDIYPHPHPRPTTSTHVTYDPRHLATLAKPNQVARASRASKCNLWFLKNLYECWFIPNCTRKILWIHAKIWLFPLYVSLLVTAPYCSLQMTTSTKIMVKVLTGEYWKIKTQKLEICLLKTDVFCHFMFSTFYVFPLPPRKEIQLLPRFLCCVLFIWVLVEESVTTGVSSMAFFVVHAGFYSRVRRKLKRF